MVPQNPSDEQPEQSVDTVRRSRRALYTHRLILFGAVTVLFALSIPPRLPWFGKMTTRASTNSDFETALAIQNTNEWLGRPGPFTPFVRIHILAPISPNGRRLNEGIAGYLPLFLMPLYLPARITGEPPGLKWAASWGLLNHWASTLLGACVVYCTCVTCGLGFPCVLLLSLASSILFLFLPGPMYYFQAVFWPDILVIAPFLLAVLLEVIRDAALERGRPHRGLDILQAAVLLGGMLIDWFMFVAFAAIGIKRLWLRQFGGHRRCMQRGILIFSLPFFGAGALATIYIFVTGNASALVEHFLVHTGLFGAAFTQFGRALSQFGELFWHGHIVRCLGVQAPWMLWSVFLLSVGAVAGSWGYSRWRRRPIPLSPHVRALSALFLLVVPCFVHSYVLREHSLENNYASLKYVVPFSCGCFGLLPAGILITTRWTSSAMRRTIVACIVLASAIAVAVSNRIPGADLFGETTDVYERIGRTVADNLRGQEYVVAPRLYAHLSDGLDQIREMGKYGAFAERLLHCRNYTEFDANDPDTVKQIGLGDEDVVIVAPDPLSPVEESLQRYAVQTWRSNGLAFLRFRPKEFLAAVKSS